MALPSAGPAVLLTVLQSVPIGVILGNAIALGLALVPVGIGGISLYRWHTLRQDEANQHRVALDGPIEVAGTVQPVEDEPPVYATVSGQGCVVCEIEVQQYTSNQYGGSWTRKASRSERHPFLVDSPIGTVRVDPDEADVFLADQVVATVGKGEEPTGRVAGLFEAVDVDTESVFSQLDPTGDLLGSKYRVVERRIDIGQEVYAAGTADSDTDVTVGFDSPDAVVRHQSDPSLQERLFGLPFVVGDKGESAARNHFLRRGALYTAGGLLLFALVVAGIT